MREVSYDDLIVHKDIQKYSSLRYFKLDEDDFNTIKVQFLALKLMSKSDRNRSVKDTSTYWTLTPYGENKMLQLRAIHNEEYKTEKNMTASINNLKEKD